MIWRKLGSNAYLQFLSGAPEIELSLRLLVDGEVTKIREYTEADLDETCLLSHIQIRPHTRHLSWRPVVTLVQNIDDVSATAVGDTEIGAMYRVHCADTMLVPLWTFC